MIPPSPTAPSLRVAFRHMLTAGAFIALAAALASCSLTRPSPVKHMFLLEPTPPAAVSTAAKPVSIRIGVVNVAAPFRSRQFVFRESDLKFESDFYDEFFVAPAIMVSDATAKALAASNAFRRVVPFGATSDDGDYTLDGFVSELYADMRDAAAPAAVITVTYYLTPTGALEANVVWSREYRQHVRISGAGPEAVARGWNAALSAILADLARDLAAAELPPK
jgi:cholesterol transport system auxiliary component